jgi:hypothetical protein
MHIIHTVIITEWRVRMHIIMDTELRRHRCTIITKDIISAAQRIKVNAMQRDKKMVRRKMMLCKKRMVHKKGKRKHKVNSQRKANNHKASSSISREDKNKSRVQDREVVVEIKVVETKAVEGKRAGSWWLAVCGEGKRLML